HLESAAGIAGLIKTALALKHAEIPAHLHFRKPNPNIPWSDGCLVVPVERQNWPATNKRRRAAVSAFGASGTNAHVILEQPPAVDLARAANQHPMVMTISAKTEDALRQLSQRYVEFLRTTSNEFADICFSANTGRSAFGHRIAVIAETAEDVLQKLTAF